MVGPPSEKSDCRAGNSTFETMVSGQEGSASCNHAGVPGATPGGVPPVSLPSGRPMAAAAPLHQASANPLRLSHYWKLACDRHAALFELLQGLTGLPPSLVWAPELPDEWAGLDLLRHSGMCRAMAGRSEEALARCQACALQHLASTLQPGYAGHQFTCRRGVQNFWFPINVRRCTVGIAFIQALDHHPGGPTSGAAATAAPSTPAEPVPALETCCPSGGARRISCPDFERAARLLQLICEQVQALALTDLWRTDLNKLQQELLVSEEYRARLRKELSALLPAIRPIPHAPALGSHAEWLVQHLLELLDRDYARQVTLKQCSNALGLNAAYLSALFSRVVGMPFKAYLTELRMEKAREFLSDPARTISEVAYSVGYASENRFRNAFKKAIGLPPRIWRETVRVSHSALLVWLLDDLDFLDGLGGLFLG